MHEVPAGPWHKPQTEGQMARAELSLARMKKTLFGAFILFWFSTFEAFWGKKKS